MLKIDKKVAEEFLGTTNVDWELISPLKTIRSYHVNDGDKTVLILTPSIREDGTFLKTILEIQEKYSTPMKAIEHKRGKNYVYTLEPKDE